MHEFVGDEEDCPIVIRRIFDGDGYLAVRGERAGFVRSNFAVRSYEVQGDIRPQAALEVCVHVFPGHVDSLDGVLYVPVRDAVRGKDVDICRESSLDRQEYKEQGKGKNFFQSHHAFPKLFCKYSISKPAKEGKTKSPRKGGG